MEHKMCVLFSIETKQLPKNLFMNLPTLLPINQKKKTTKKNCNSLWQLNELEYKYQNQTIKSQKKELFLLGYANLKSIIKCYLPFFTFHEMNFKNHTLSFCCLN